MQKCFAEGSGPVYRDVISWLQGSNAQLQLSGALAIANFARNGKILPVVYSLFYRHWKENIKHGNSNIKRQKTTTNSREGSLPLGEKDFPTLAPENWLRLVFGTFLPLSGSRGGSSVAEGRFPWLRHSSSQGPT